MAESEVTDLSRYRSICLELAAVAMVNGRGYLATWSNRESGQEFATSAILSVKCLQPMKGLHIPEIVSS
ncbi:hypothetical protein WOLCODRAFT_27201, partial [Wolfiporia cocos MD-104 SS10]